MADDWQLATLGDAIDLNPQVKLDRDVVYPFVDMAALDPGRRSVGPSEDRVYKGSGSRFAHGDTLFARITPCLENGKICRYSAPELAASVAHGSTEFIVLRGKPGITDSGFVYYLSRSDDLRTFAVGQMNGSSGRQRVPVTSFASYPFLLPPYEDQLVIASILGALDDKIELNRRMAQTFEEMARALFKSWFVDFDPVRAKAEGRDPDVPKHLAEMFPDRFVDSELGEIPDGWRVSTLGDHVENLDSKRVPLSGAVRSRRQGVYPYHGAAGVLDHIDDFLFEGVHVLVGEDGSVLRSEESGLAVTQYVWGKFWVNNHAHVLRGKGEVSSEQLYLYFDFVPIAPYVTGAVQAKLSQGRMNLMPFVFPGATLCAAFANIVVSLFARIRHSRDEANTLEGVRNALLAKLVSGEVRLPDPEALLARLGAVA